MYAHKKFLCRPRPYPLESLASYIIRLAESNYYSSSGWIFRFSNLQSRIIHANVFNKEKDDLSLLSFISDVEESILWSMTFSAISLISSGHVISVDAFDSIISKKALHKNYTNLCPICLQHQPYYLLIWDFSFIHICPIHNCLLINKCQICHEKIKIYRASITLCKCSQSFCDSQPIFFKSESVNLALHVYKLCKMIKSEPEDTEKLFSSNPIMLLNLNHLVKLLYYVVDFSKLPYIKDKFLSRLQSQVELFKYGCYFEMIFSILNNWSHEFISIMSGYENYLASSYPSIRMTDQKHQHVLSLFESMVKCFPGEKYRFFRGVIEDYFWNFLFDISIKKLKVAWRQRISFPYYHDLNSDISKYSQLLSTVAEYLKIKELTLTELFVVSKIEILRQTLVITIFDYWLD